MAYKRLKNNSLKDSAGYQIVAIRQADIEDIRVWRNAQMEILRQNAPLSYEAQQQYFQQNILPTFQQEYPSQILFSFLLQEKCIGYGGLVYIDWKNLRAEISFLLDPLRKEGSEIHCCDFFHFLKLLCQAAFKDLHLHRLYTEIFAFRHAHIKIVENFGFRQEGILREHVYKRHQWVDSYLHGLLASDWKLIECKKEMLEREKRTTEHSSVLITSISKKMPLIEAVRMAANQLGQFQDIHGCDSDSLCIGQYGVDKFWHCPSLEKMTLENIVAYCQKNKITAIIPTRDADLEFYARHLASFHKIGIYPMVSSLETILSCLDKRGFADRLIQHHLPAIPTYLSLEEFHSSSYVVKERKGAGSLQLGLDLTRHEALEHSCKLKLPIFQPFIKGQEWSVDVYRSFEGKVKGCVARQRNYVVNGESQVTTTAHYPALEHLCYQMADLLKIKGHAVFQVIEDEERKFHIIECNPRFGGASTASLAVGLDSFLWFFAECLGLSLHEYPFMRSKEDMRQVRYMKDRLLPWLSCLT